MLPSLLPSLLVALLAPAEPPGSESGVELDPLVVEGQRQVGGSENQPFSISRRVIDADEAARQQLEFTEFLADIPGVFVQNHHNFAQDARIAVRGFGARASFGIRGLEIRQDGFPASLPDGQGQVDSIDPTLISAVEVLRGPASVQYGNAAGGAILLSTIEGGDPNADELGVSLGSYDFRRAHARTGFARQGSETLLSLSEMSIDGYRDNSQAKTRHLLIKNSHEFTNGLQLLSVLRGVDAPEANDPGGLTWAQVLENPRQARAANLRFKGGEALDQQQLALSLSPADENPWRLYGFHVQRYFENFLPFSNGGAVVIDRRFQGLAIERPWQFAGQLELLTGLEYERQDDDRLRFDNLDGLRGELRLDQLEQADSLAGFALASWTFRPGWQAFAGVRHDRLQLQVDDRFPADGDDSGSRDFDETTWSTGLSWQPDLQGWESQTFFINRTEAFESPTFTELANPQSPGGFNPELTPQNSEGHELGWRRAGSRWRTEISLFDLDIDNELLPFEREDQPGRTFFQNAGKSTRRGLEAFLQGDFADDWQITVSWTWSDFEFSGDQSRFASGRPDLAGNDIPGIPEQQLFVQLDWQLSPQLALIIDGRYVDQVWADDRNLNAAPSYTTLGLRGLYQWPAFQGDWSLSAGINNFTDERYIDNVRINAFGGRFYEPAPDRNFYLNLGFQY